MNTDGQDRQNVAVISFILSFVGFWCWMIPEIGFFICAISVVIGHYSRQAILPMHGVAGVKFGLVGRNLAIVGSLLHIFMLFLIS